MAGAQSEGSLAVTEPRSAGFGREAGPKAPKVTGPAVEPPWPWSAVPLHSAGNSLSQGCKRDACRLGGRS
jgi:hypothetical protein